jgi:hypothetical protein
MVEPDTDGGSSSIVHHDTRHTPNDDVIVVDDKREKAMKVLSSQTGEELAVFGYQDVAYNGEAKQIAYKLAKEYMNGYVAALRECGD